MKIRTDVSDILYANVGGNKTSPGMAPLAKNSAPSYSNNSPSLQSITSRISTDRSLSEALSIAQASQSLLQKAMIISSQLRSIANQAVIQGKVNSADLEVVLSDINSDFGAYSRGTTAPIQAFVQGKVSVPELPGVADDMKAVTDIAGAMEQGNVPRIGVIDNTMQRISGKIDLYSKAVAGYSGILRENAAPAINEGKRMDITAEIAGNPQGALNAQGNLNPEGVYRTLS